MFIPYSKISNKSKVWIYQSNKKINHLNELNQKLMTFCNNWETHGQPVTSSFKLYDWFICLFADETRASVSGCSIDTSVSFIKSIGKKYVIDFFNHKNIIFLDKEVATILPLSQFKSIIKDDIIIYNNTVKTKEEFETKWKLAVKDSWLNRFLIN